MSQAPALPAQTPGMFVGGGGSGTELTGECAAAVADCGLSEVDFAPFEQLIEVVRAAHDRCHAYDEARHLDEQERSFDTDPTRASRSGEREVRLPRRPTSRERHLSLCIAAPLLDPSFYRTRSGDPETNLPADPARGLPGALGYDPALAPAAPQYVGASIRTGVHTAFSTLYPEVRYAHGSDGAWRLRSVGEPLSADELRMHRARRIAAILRDAQDEDTPRLRGTYLMSSTRPRQAESDRRAIEQVLPEPPQIPSEVAPSASGAGPGGDESDGSGSSSQPARAGGCVNSVADAQQREMQRRVRDEYGDGYAERERATHAAEREAHREHMRAMAALESARYAARAARRRLDPLARARTEAAERKAARTATRTLVDRAATAAAGTALASLRAQAMQLHALTAERGQLSGRVPQTGRAPATYPVMESISSFDG